MTTLEGRRLLVTGASSGIGEATARAASRAGARVALLARSADRLEELASELGGVAVPADVTDVTATREAVDAGADRLGGLDGLVNSAGLVHPSSVADGHPDEWRQMFDVNVLGLLYATQAAIPHLRRAGGGNIVNVSSMSGRRVASQALSIYSGTKFAVHAISEGMRKELHAEGIRVTICSPGLVDTPIFDHVAEVEVRSRYQQAVAERGLTPESVGEQIVHALAAPPDVTVYELALYHIDQD